MLFRSSFCLLAALALANATNGVMVNLRIEGENKTIFEGPVFTQGHNVTTLSGGTHHCDGTNNGANVLPGATCTSALDDAAKRHNFSFDGCVLLKLNDMWVIKGIH